MAEPKRNDPAPVSPQPAAGGIAARALGARAAPYLADLNPEQRQAVETLDGPVLVLAGAGTGKTRVLTTRIAHILNLGRAHPSQILAVTFTNKAAREMKERVGQMVGQIVEGMPWLGTFHSIGVKILRRHAELVGLKNNFTILDVDDQIRVIKQILEAEKLDEKRWPARVLAMLIDGWKNRGLTPEQVPSGEAASFANGKGKKLYIAYQERLKTLNAADFGDLLAGEHPAVPAERRCAALVSGAVQVHPGRRVPGHQRRAVSVAEAAGADDARAVTTAAASPSPQRGEVRASDSEPGEEARIELTGRAPGPRPSPLSSRGARGMSRERPPRSKATQKHLLRRR